LVWQTIVGDVAVKVLASRAKDDANAEFASVVASLIIHQAVLEFEPSAFRDRHVHVAHA
jgi:hypothetical protein